MKPLLLKKRLVEVTIEMRTNIPIHRLTDRGAWATAIEAAVGWHEDASFELTKPVSVETLYRGHKRTKKNPPLRKKATE